MKRVYHHLIFGVFMSIMVVGLVHSTLNIETLEEWGVEARRLQDECDARTPEGYICIVDYFPKPPYPLFFVGIIVLAFIVYYIEIKEEVKD